MTFTDLDLDEPLPVVPLVAPLEPPRPPLVTRTGLTPQERAIAEAIAPPKPDR